MTARLAVLLALLMVAPCVADCDGSEEVCEPEDMAMLQAAKTDGEHVLKSEAEAEGAANSSSGCSTFQQSCGTCCPDYSFEKGAGRFKRTQTCPLECRGGKCWITNPPPPGCEGGHR